MALDINNNNKINNNSDTDNSKKSRENSSSSESTPTTVTNHIKSEDFNIVSLDKKMQENCLDMQHQVDYDSNNLTSPMLNNNVEHEQINNNNSLLSKMGNNSSNGGGQLVAGMQSCSNQEAIELLLKRTGYPLRQENGQRKYGPPPNWDPSQPEPDRGCEIFIGKIPRDCFEDEIVPLLERVGMLYEFRLMMEYSGYNRGYGFAMFTSRDDAKKAVVELNNYEIRKGRMIGICRSVDNCRLFVGGIPKSKTKEEILEEMRKITDDVVNVIVYPSAHDKSKNRGFAFVQYTNHRAAAIARRKLIPNRIQLFGQPIAVDWAEPEPEVDEDVMATVKVLYVRNLMLSTSEEQIKAEFEKIKEGMIERVKKMKDFAFVHFKERDDALRCMRLMNGATIDGALVEVSLSKPIDKNSFMRFTRGTPSPTNQLLTNAALAAAVANSPNAPVITIPFQTVAALTATSIDNGVSASTTAPSTGANTSPNIAMQQQFTQFQQQNLLTTVPSTASQTPTNYPIPAQFLASAASYQADLLAQQQQAIMNNTNKTHRSSRAVSSNSRGTAGLYRYYVKGVAGTVKKQASSQDIPYDLYSGINPVPLLPFNPFINYPNKTSTQILEEICLKENFGSPIYTLHSTRGNDHDGREIGLYIYRITIPGLFQGKPVCSTKLHRNIEEAKIDAADFVLSQIYPQPPFLDLNEYYANAQTPPLQQTTNQQQHPQNTQIPAFIYHHPAQAAHLQGGLNTPPELMHPHLSHQQRNAIHSALLQQQQQQQQNQSTNGSTNDLSTTSLYNGPQLSGPQVNRPVEFVSAQSGGPPLMQPQYILDPTGQYIVCQASLWQ